ncbi:MAG: hypothetical protein AAGC60_15230 [Acidobacteriota bacterium]
MPLTDRGAERRVILAALLVALVPWASSATAQGGSTTERPVLDGVQELDFDEPEAWAMNTFAAISLLTSLGAVEQTEPGAVDVGLELLQAPHLDSEQRRVGFGGFKEEDLNRSPVWVRLRAGVGLPGGLRLLLAWAPPVEIDGVEASLFSAALERRLWASGRWSLGGRVYAQIGEADGDFTCQAGEDHLFPPGTPKNPFGCEEPSRDTVALDYAGLQLVAAYRLGAAATVHAGVAWSRVDTEFQVRAETFGFSDRTLLVSDGDLVSWTAGVGWRLGGAGEADFGRLVLEAFYTPLDVERPRLDGAGRERSSDPLLNLRLGWSLRLR